MASCYCCFYTSDVRLILFVYGTDSFVYRCFGTDARVRNGLSFDLSYRYPFVEVSVGLNTFINTQGRPGIAMLSIVIGALLNILLDPLFIFVFDWGVKGAALATIISQACSAGWVLFFLTSRRASLRLEPRYMRLDRKVVGAILALGASPFIMASTESLVGFVLNGSLKTFGDIYVSALTIMQSAMLLSVFPLPVSHWDSYPS